MTLTQINSKGIKDGEILNADIHPSAAIAGSKIDGGSFTTNLIVTNSNPFITLVDNNANSDFKIDVDGGLFSIKDNTNVDAKRLVINSSGYVGVKRDTPLSWLHVANGELASNTNPTSSAAPNTTYDALVVDGENVPVINLRSRGDGNDSYGALFFSDNVRAAGQFVYRHKVGSDTDFFEFTTQAGTQDLRIQKNASDKSVLGISNTAIPTNSTFRSNLFMDYAWLGTYRSGSNIQTVLTNNIYYNSPGGYHNFENANSTMLHMSGGVAKFYRANNAGSANAAVTTEIMAEFDVTGVKLPSGKGINFSAYAYTGNPSSNLLDDYEEGTFTPTLGWGLTLSTATGRYTKIGRMVTYTIQAIWPTSSNNNYAFLGSLPFDGVAGGNAGGGFIRYTNYNGGSDLTFHQNSNNSITLYQDSGTTITNGTLSGKRFDLVGFYYTAS